MALEGAELIILPAAFNMTTGTTHWELSIRMRALDNQVYFVGAAPARDESASYVACGNSRVADPWGKIIATADENIRMRALDNQVYFVGAAPARDESASYVACGNSRVADPWGKIIATADEKECIIYADIDKSYTEKVRNELPLLKHRRTDLYSVNFF